MSKFFSKKIFVLLIASFIILNGCFFVNNSRAALYEGGTGAKYLDLIGEHGFETSSGGAPDTTIVDIIIVIINSVLSFLGIIFLALIIYGGYTWMFSGGNEQSIEKAKKILINSSIGVAVVLSSAAISQLVINTIDEEDMDIEEWMSSDRSITDIIVSIINIALGVFGVLFTGMIIYGGFLWMFSGGNEEKVSKAKKMLVNSVIGAIIVLLSFAITQFVSSAVGG